MTQKHTLTTKEKIDLLKETIIYLYEKEGRSKSYISKILNINRKELSGAINEWGLIKADQHHLTPSNEKFLNRHRKQILDQLDSDVAIGKIAETLEISSSSLVRTFINSDKELLHHYNMAKDRKRERTQNRIQEAMDRSRLEYDFMEFENEEWKPVLGYEDYDVSNYGRIRRYVEHYQKHYLIKPAKNQVSGRLYISLHNKDGDVKNLSLARVVAHTFVDGYSERDNTVDHIDGNFENNRADNLEWVTQGENNLRAYANGKKSHASFSKHKRFKSIKVDGKYEFKTIRAMAKFLEVSEAQAGRYLDGKSKTSHTFEFIYS